MTVFSINSFSKTGGRMSWFMGHDFLISNLIHRPYSDMPNCQ